MVRQGELYWLDLGFVSGSEQAGRHPCVVIQNDLFNERRVASTVVCQLTSNLRRAESPGNVLLDSGEGGLSKPSVVNVTQVFTIDKGDLTDRIGALSSERTRQILDGVWLLLEPT